MANVFRVVFFSVVILTFPSVVYSEEERVKALLNPIEDLLEVVADSRIRGAVSPSTGQVSHSFFIFSNKSVTKGIEILIEELTLQSQLYSSLEFNDWADVTKRLMVIDDLFSEDVYWGNLVLKFFIQDYIGSSIYARLTSGDDKPGRYLQLVKDLRERAPTMLSALKIALQHYGISGIANSPDRLDLRFGREPLGEKYKKSEFDFSKAKNQILMDSKMEAWLTEKYNQEPINQVDDYVDLLYKEPVFRTVLLADYFAMITELYMYVCFQDYFLGEGGVSVEKFDGFVNKCSPREEEIFRSHNLQAYEGAVSKVDHPYTTVMIETNGANRLVNTWSGRGFFPHKLIGR